MRIAIATDAWYPQVNGVVRTLAATVAELGRRGHEVEPNTPDRFLTVPLPGYSSIRLAMAPRFTVRRTLDAFAPDIVHISTEGPIGWSARSWSLAREVPFTPAFHTRFPGYASGRTGISAERLWPIIQRFHAPSRAVLVATRSLEDELEGRGIGPTRPWSRGSDHGMFRPEGELYPALKDLQRPILLNVGRVAPEKNLEQFLDAQVPGTKVVVGEGPSLQDLRRRYPDAVFLGALLGEYLASAYRAADCFVFPSRTDTFGLVVIEALASGVPVAALPVAGPRDILGLQGRGPRGDFPERVGVVDEDLSCAITGALRLDRKAAAAFGALHSWERATDQFLDAIHTAAGSRTRSRATQPV